MRVRQAGETDKRYLFDKQKELSEKLQKVKDQATNHKVYSHFLRFNEIQFY